MVLLKSVRTRPSASGERKSVRELIKSVRGAIKSVRTRNSLNIYIYIAEIIGESYALGKISEQKLMIWLKLGVNQPMCIGNTCIYMSYMYVAYESLYILLLHIIFNWKSDSYSKPKWWIELYEVYATKVSSHVSTVMCNDFL